MALLIQSLVKGNADVTSALGRACFRSGEIRVLDSTDCV